MQFEIAVYCHSLSNWCGYLFITQHWHSAMVVPVKWAAVWIVKLTKELWVIPYIKIHYCSHIIVLWFCTVFNNLCMILKHHAFAKVTSQSEKYWLTGYGEYSKCQYISFSITKMIFVNISLIRKVFWVLRSWQAHDGRGKLSQVPISTGIWVLSCSEIFCCFVSEVSSSLH